MIGQNPRACGSQLAPLCNTLSKNYAHRRGEVCGVFAPNNSDNRRLLPEQVSITSQEILCACVTIILKRCSSFGELLGVRFACTVPVVKRTRRPWGDFAWTATLAEIIHPFFFFFFSSSSSFSTSNLAPLTNQTVTEAESEN